MELKKIEKNFTKEEIELLRTILLGRSTFYASKITDFRVRQLKAKDEEVALVLHKAINYEYERLNVVNKFLDFLKG